MKTTTLLSPSVNMKSKFSLRVSSMLWFASLFAASALPGSAAIIAYDTFTGYTDGQLNGQGQGLGWSSNWSGSTSYTVSNSVGLSPGSGGGASTGSTTGWQTINRSFTSTLPTDGSVYFGYLLQQQGNFQGGGLQINSAGSAPRAWGAVWNGYTTSWLMGYSENDSSWGAADTYVARSNATTFFVLRLDLNSAGQDRVSLFVNPADEAALAGTPSASRLFTNNFAPPTGLSFDINNTVPGTLLDEVRVGTAAADMFTAIPEPGAAFLGSLGLLALLRRRRD
jgi:MYXO-CTERM domain-containing protein